MEALDLNQFKALFQHGSRWHTTAEQPLHPTSLNQVFLNEIVGIRERDFLVPESVKDLLGLMKGREDFGPRLETFKESDLQNYFLLAKASNLELGKLLDPESNPLADLISLISSYASRTVERLHKGESLSFLGAIRTLQGNLKLSHDHAGNLLSVLPAKIESQVRWMIPLAVSAAPLSLEVRHGEDIGHLKFQVGDLLIWNQRNQQSVEAGPGKATCLEGFIAKLANGEILIWS